MSARRSPTRQSWIGAVPATRSRKRVGFASSSCAARKKVPPVRLKHHAIVGSDRGDGASRELRSESLSLGNMLRLTRIGARRPLDPAPSSRGHRHRLQGGVSGRRTVWAERPALTMDERGCWEPRRRQDRCSPSPQERRCTSVGIGVSREYRTHDVPKAY